MVGCLELEFAVKYRVSISGIHQTFFAQRVHDDGSHSVSSLTVARVFPNVTVGRMHAHFARIWRVDEDRVYGRYPSRDESIVGILKRLSSFANLGSLRKRWPYPSSSTHRESVL